MVRWRDGGCFRSAETFPYTLKEVNILGSDLHSYMSPQDLLFVCQIPLDLKKVLQNFKQRKTHLKF